MNFKKLNYFSIFFLFIFIFSNPAFAILPGLNSYTDGNGSHCGYYRSSTDTGYGTFATNGYVNFFVDSSTSVLGGPFPFSGYGWKYLSIIRETWNYPIASGGWQASTIYGPIQISQTLTSINNIPFTSSQLPPASTAYPSGPPEGCGSVPTCESKTGEVGYNLYQYLAGQQEINFNPCYEGCKQTGEITWELCTGQSCAASVKFTYTGEQCEEGLPDVEDLQPNEPEKCTQELLDLTTKCGGSLKVQSFDFETCTGTCTPDSCGPKWAELVNRCGGFMAVSSWDDETCSGTCVNDPVPDIGEPDSEAIPDDIKTETQINPDGSKEVTQTSTYNVDGKTYTNTTVNTYDSEGNHTGTSSTGTVGVSGSGESETPEPSVDVPGTWYTSIYDTSNGFSSAINYDQFFNATSRFQETFVYQLPNLLLQCLGYVEGNGCQYPPTVTVDFLGHWTSGPVTLDLSPFAQVVQIMKFFFSILCIVGTSKAVMALFN